MEIRGMVGNQPVRVVLVANEWLDIIDISSGDELASLPVKAGIRLDGDFLSVGRTSIQVDRTYLSEAQSMINLASRIQSISGGRADVSLPFFCTQCGTQRDQSAKFCTNCGSAFGSTSEVVSQTSLGHKPIRSTWDGADSGSETRDELEPSALISRQEISDTKRRNLIFLGALVVVGAVVVIVARGGGDSSTGSSVNIRDTSACATLSDYAYVGIPATFIDDGAQLLYSLASDFNDYGRGDVASLIEEVVDLTYGGPSGQLQAKSLLIETANTYC